MWNVVVRTLNQMGGSVAIVYWYYTCILCKKIHEIYILPRWTKNVKKNIWNKFYGTQFPPTGLKTSQLSTVRWRHGMGRKFYNLVLKLQGREKTRKVVEELYNTISEKVSKMIEAAEREIEALMQTIETTRQ